jgi:hypothetical protein
MRAWSLLSPKWLPARLMRLPLQARPKLDGSAMSHAPWVEQQSCGRASSVSSWRAIGPVVAAELEALGVRVNITPRGNTFFMKPLVRELAAALASS